jgi:hypothetical protein
MMALVLPRYLSLLIDGMERENLGERAILREIKLLPRPCHLARLVLTSAGRRVFKIT